MSETAEVVSTGAMGQAIYSGDLMLAREIQQTMKFTTHADLLHLVVLHGDGTSANCSFTGC